MKYRSEQRARTVSHSIGGTTHDVREPYSVRVPVLPRDWDAVAMRAAAGLVLALTAIAVVWSTVSIGALLHGGVGYAAAALFDISWIVVLLLEWMARFDPRKRRFARSMGWVLLVVTMGSIFWHGMLLDSVALAVIGAGVSAIAKALWMGIMRHVDRDLSDADQQWVTAEMSKANAQLAIAGVRRQAAAAEVRARLELLAAERVLGELNELTERPANKAEQVAEHEPEPIPAAPVAPPLASPNTVREPAEPAPSIAELAREQITSGANNQGATAEILRLVPDANAASVAATVRRERTKLQSNGYL